MKKSAFTLVELMVVIAIIGILSATLVPSITNLTEKANAAKTISVVDTLTTACDAFYMDTGRYAYENSWGTGNYYHQLAFPYYTGWNGPYLKSPLRQADNPFKYGILLYARTRGWESDPGGQGFDLDGNGSEETGDGSWSYGGNTAIFYNVPRTAAPTINTLIDGPNEGGSWYYRGKFEYRSNYYGTFYVTGGR